jgi:hypothetical protein
MAEAITSGEELAGIAPSPSGPAISESHFSGLPASIELFSSSFCMTVIAYVCNVYALSLLQLTK